MSAGHAAPVPPGRRQRQRTACVSPSSLPRSIAHCRPTHAVQKPTSKDQAVPNGATVGRPDPSGLRMRRASAEELNPNRPYTPLAGAPQAANAPVTMSWAERAARASAAPQPIRPQRVPSGSQPPARPEQPAPVAQGPQVARGPVAPQGGRPMPAIAMPVQNPTLVPMHSSVVPPMQFGDIGPMDLQAVQTKVCKSAREFGESVCHAVCV